MHGASLRQISEAAGQKNTSAIHYHFGSREQLIEAVFIHRMAKINPDRQARLDTLKKNGRLNDMRSLISALVWPMAEELRPRPEGNHYVQFLSRAYQEKHLTIELAPTELMTAWTELLGHIEALIRYLPTDIVQTRIASVADQCVFGLAAFEAMNLGETSAFEYKVETLIDMITAGATAPVSNAAMTALEKL